MIYFLTDGFHIKIGFTDNALTTRVAELQAGNPRRLSVLATCEGDVFFEKSIHRLVGRSADGGSEWFYPRRSLLRLVARVQERGGEAIRSRMVAKSRLDAWIKREAKARNGRLKARSAALLRAMREKYGHDEIRRLTGLSGRAVQYQAHGPGKIDAVTLARLGTLERDAVLAIIADKAPILPGTRARNLGLPS